MADINAILTELGARVRKLERRERVNVYPVVTATVDVTLKAANQVVLVNGATTLTLPLAADSRYVEIRIKNISVVRVDVSPGAGNLDGSGSPVSLSNQYDSITVWSSGAAWFIIAIYP